MKGLYALLLVLSAALSAPKEKLIGRGHLDRFVGERLDFSLALRGVSAAKAHLLCDTLGPGQWTVTADLSTKFWADLVFPVHNIYQTTIDRCSSRIVETCKKIRQKNLSQEMRIVFDADKKQAHGYPDGSRGISDSLQTLFAMLYQIRSMDLSLQDSVFCVLEIESQEWLVSGSVCDGESIPGPFAHLYVRDIILYFSPYRSVTPRSWKTDLLTNRIARSGRLLIRLGPPPENLPVWLQMGEGKQTVTLKLNSRKKG